MRPPQIHRICFLGLASWCVGVVFVGHVAAAEVEPYQARVASARALVLSGPGEKFYPTGTLSPGEIVEVYREEAGGWLGVRPPQGSFSLISDKELISGGDNLAEVEKDDVSSRIGSQLSDKRNAVQVRLKKGEVVEILGKTSIHGETWFKIAPPAGEFRWIHAASVERVGPISETAPPDGLQVVPAAAASESAAAKVEEKAVPAGAAVAAAPPPNEESWRASTSPVATPAASAAAMPATSPMPEIVPPPLASAATASSPAASSTAPVSVAAPAQTAGVTPATSTPPTGFDLPRQLTDIELRLSRMASAPPQLWNTERLQSDAEALLAQAKTGAERDSVKLTMGKIDQFHALARRYQQGGQAVSRQSSAVSQSLADNRQPTADSRYDAVGILRPVVSKRPGAPQFALVDERGQVVSFVSPTPDVNLQPYLGRRVGIAGNRGFIPEFNRAHVTAGRVTPLMR